MQPRDTLYRIASAGSDYRACHAINKALGKPGKPLHFPTVVAERDGKILGYLSTHREVTWCLMAGPLEVLTPSPFMSMRLIEAYESVLKAVGITRYCFAIDKGQQGWIEQVKISGANIIAEDEKDVVFERIFPGDPYYSEQAA